MANESMGQLQSQMSALAQEYQKAADATAAERNTLQGQIQQLKTQLTTAEMGGCSTAKFGGRGRATE